MLFRSSPLPWFNHADSIVQVLSAYTKVLIKRNFDHARELYFRRWIVQSDVLLRRQEAAKAALAGAGSGNAGAPELLQSAAQPTGSAPLPPAPGGPMG